MVKRQAAGVQRMAVLNGQRRGAARSIRERTYSTGGKGRGSFPSAYLTAISQELAAERKIWSPGSWSSARACWDNRCGLACIPIQQGVVEEDSQDWKRARTSSGRVAALSHPHHQLVDLPASWRAASVTRRSS
jgi:hypothetical protein